jgi:hypothetical protein
LKATSRILFWRAALRLGAPKKYDGYSSEQLRVFFQDPANYADRSINEIESVIGICQRWSDTDFGRRFYEWIRPDLHVIVESQGGSRTNAVHFRDPRRPDAKCDVIWERRRTGDAAQAQSRTDIL